MVEVDPVVAERGRAAMESTPPVPLDAAGRGAIELRGLTKRYGDDIVVNNIAAARRQR